MNEPFAFLDEEEEDDDKGAIAWLPLTLAALALAGFLTIPILGMLNSGDPQTDWAQYEQEEEIEVGLNPLTGDLLVENQNPLLTPDPEDLRDDLMSVDETLASLGDNYVPAVAKIDVVKKGLGLGVTKKAGAELKAKKRDKNALKRPNLVKIDTSPNKAIRRPIGQQPNDTSTTKAVRRPTVQQPRETNVAAKAIRPTKIITVQPGDTLYGIARNSDSTPDEIGRMNNVNPKTPIHVGQKLRVPGYPDAPAAGQTAAVRAQLLTRPESVSPIGNGPPKLRRPRDTRKKL